MKLGMFNGEEVKKLLLVEKINHNYYPARPETSKLVLSVSSNVSDDEIMKHTKAQWEEEYYMCEEFLSCCVYDIDDKYEVSDHFNNIIQDRIGKDA